MFWQTDISRGHQKAEQVSLSLKSVVKEEPTHSQEKMKSKKMKTIQLNHKPSQVPPIAAFKYTALDYLTWYKFLYRERSHKVYFCMN